MAREGMSLYGLINGLWDYWGKGFAIPLLSYGVEIEAIGDYFIVSIT